MAFKSIIDAVQIFKSPLLGCICVFTLISSINIPQAFAEPLYFDDGGTYYVDYTVNDGIFIGGSTVYVQDGASIASSSELYGNAIYAEGGTVNIQGGLVTGGVSTFSQEFIMSGGVIEGGLGIYGSDTTISGGTISSIFSESVAHLDISGGTFGNIFTISGTYDISGGVFLDVLGVGYDRSANMDITGGDFSGGFEYGSGSEDYAETAFTFFGDLSLTVPVLIDVVSPDVLIYETIVSGMLLDGDVISQTITCSDFISRDPCSGVAVNFTPIPSGYIITDLGMLDGTASYGYGVNDSGEVVGSRGFTNGTAAFLYNGNKMLDLGTLGGKDSHGRAINDEGWATGYSQTLTVGHIFNAVNHAFLYDGNTMQDLGTLDGTTLSWGQGINNNGWVTGFSQSPGITTRAFLYDGNTMRDLGTLGGAYSVGNAINNKGWVTGSSDLIDSFLNHAFLYDGNTMRDLGTLGGASSVGNAINDKGWVTGSSHTLDNALDGVSHAFLYDGNTMRDLGTLGGTSSYGTGINNNGVVVGYRILSDRKASAFLYDGSKMLDLCALVHCMANGWDRLSSADGISDNGNITGRGIINGETHAFLISVGTNVLPTANAGVDQIVNENDTVNLNGALSSDSDSSMISYSWTQTGGATVVLDDASSVAPSFTAPVVTADTILTFSLVVTDNSGGVSVADSVKVTVKNVNVLPTANADIDQIVNENTAVLLNGNLSFDSDGSITSYSWTQTGGAAVVLDGASTAAPFFVAPAVAADTILTFSLIVTDNDGGVSVANSVKVTVRNINVLPTANAGVDQTVSESDAVNLNGNLSFDSDGGITSFNWVQTGGSAVVLSGANTATASFVAPSVTTGTILTFSLVVTDNNGGRSSTDVVRVTVNNVNVLPTANAGIDLVVYESDAVNLNGSLSSDSDGSITSYKWTQTGGRAVVLSGANTAFSSFAAPVVANDEILTFSLIVTDNDGGVSAADTIKITVNNDNGLPRANAGVDQIVNEGVVVDLDGQASSDSDGEISGYRWTQTAGTNVTISGANTATPSFRAPSVISDSVLVFSLKVTDNNGDTNTDTDTSSVTITVTNVLMVDAGADQQITEGEAVQLNGLNSQGVSGNIDSYQWIQTEGPTVTLDNSNSATPIFIAPAVNLTKLLVFKLIVFDSNGSLDSDTVFVNVRDEFLTGIASPLVVQLINTVVSVNELYEFDTLSDPFFDSTSIQWIQINGPTVTLENADQAIPSFIAPAVVIDSVATFEVRSENIDGLVMRASASVNILGLTSVNQAPTANAGIDQVVTEGETVYLDATASMDSDGSIVSYYWQQTAGPMVMLTSIIEAQASFVAPAIAAVDDGTELTFELVVTDDGGFVDRQSLTITLLDNGIIAFADNVTAVISSSSDPIGIQPITGGSLVALVVVDPETIADDINRPDSLPYGLLDISLRVEPGATVQVSIVLPSPVGTNLTWWKYANGVGWLDYSANTAFNAARDVVTITLTDNSIGDDDPTLGVIRDPGGLALVSAPVTGGGSTSSGGGGGSMGPLLLMLLLLEFLARTYARVHYMEQAPFTYE